MVAGNLRSLGTRGALRNARKSLRMFTSIIKRLRMEGQGGRTVRVIGSSVSWKLSTVASMLQRKWRLMPVELGFYYQQDLCLWPTPSR